ncbi:MAG: Phosphoribosylformylglycinamidine synthase, synthetase subunit [Ignavibacteriae bacterium]|nr:MAG: Phosphoribosylformylglycinamidine synthase, synthetase subunit [Ignavibacteriota bacterium]
MKEPEVNLQLALEHGLNEDEYQKIIDILGRTPTYTELGIFSVMWSEHCSYKNSIALLKTLPRKGERVLVQAGEENAGLIDIGDGLAVAFKIESHNHPSAVEPYQGAATGVGGILRDIFTMGARPIAVLNSLRFGNLKNPRVKYLFKNVVKGISDYGNCFGVPTIAGEIYFEECYTENPIVNVMAVGIVEHSHIMKAVAKGKGNSVMIVGSSTGRDGIHGATFASQELDEESENKRPSVQVGDPFTEKLLLEATLEAIKSGYLIGVQDMGAAGITCSTSEMSARGNSGMTINLENVPVRERDMTAYEIMLSESQERMLYIIQKGKESEIAKILQKWELKYSIIGEVDDTEYLKVYFNGDLKANIPAKALVLGHGAPVYNRETKVPEYINKIRNIDYKTIPAPSDLGEILIKLISFPNICSKKWVFSQYDSMVGTNTIPIHMSDAGIVRIKGKNKALVLKTDGNGRYTYLNPRKGAEIAVAESARNIVCQGGIPIAITNCLNFGNPYDPEMYWQFSESVKGLGNACSILNTPVTGGNVSFYNESLNYTVFPTPVVGMLGLIENLDLITEQGFKQESDVIVLIGLNPENLDGSEYLKLLTNKIIGDAPLLDLYEEKKVQNAVQQLIRLKLIKSAHDVSDGGIAITLAESCIAGNIGCKINIDYHQRLDFALFNENQSKIVVTCDESKLDDVKIFLSNSGVFYKVLGTVGGNYLNINEQIRIQVNDLAEYYFSTLDDLI